MTKLASIEDVQTLLTSNKIPFTTIKHPPVMTVQEMIEKVKAPNGAPITFCKNLVFTNKKVPEHIMIVALHDTEVDLKALRFHYKAGSKDIRQTEETILAELLNVKKGSINPFSLYNDKDSKMKIVFDSKMLEKQTVTFHPMQNDALLELTTPDFLKFIKEIAKKQFEVIDFTKLKAENEKKSEETKTKTEAKKEEKTKKGKKDEKLVENALGMEYSKEDSFPNWYAQVLKKSEMIEYCTDISGCYVLRPWSYAIWEKIQAKFDSRIKLYGVENAYFPMFVSQSALNKEKDHVEGFKAEVAWVTRSGDKDLLEPLAIRPTSETIMYPWFQKWVKSYRDLPILINQWSNIVRWEFKDPTPFIRTREFLWQEGHTAHATKKEAEEMVQSMLKEYKLIYEDLLAVPVIMGAKSTGEKFPGGEYTTSVETIIPSNGRGVQAATSHLLGQNFSKMFEIQFLDDKETKQYVWQTSWGLTTRTIGILVAVHGDNKGLVLPPLVAAIQVVIIPIGGKKVDIEAAEKEASELLKLLQSAGIRAKVDNRDIYSPGWKFNYWEMKGVPVRIEIGKKEIESKAYSICRRDTNEKSTFAKDSIVKDINELLVNIQKTMLAKAKKAIDARIIKVDNWKSFIENMCKRNTALAPWCQCDECEEASKKNSGIEFKQLAKSSDKDDLMTGSAKIFNIPYEQPELLPGTKCFSCGKDAKCYALWGRSY